LTVLGTAAGQLAALMYARGMLQMLSANWPGGENLNFLTLHAEALSFVFGSAGSLIVSLFTLWWATRSLSKLSPLSLLRGETLDAPALREKSGYAPAITVLAILLAVATIFFGFRASSHEQQAAMFFMSGAFLLTAALAATWVELRSLRRAVDPQPSLWRLGIRNAGRQAVRSVLTVGLLASASFLIVAVESFHKDTDQQFHQTTGGSGGYAFFAEGSIPVFEDLNQIDVRRERGLDTPELRRLKFFPCRVQPGDDASCLGLYKPLKPRVMGVPNDFITRGGFSFAAVQATSDKANPWELLNAKAGDEIPAIIDKNTADWILKVGVGDTIDVNNERGENVKLRVVALLNESIFQSEVLISDRNFRALFPQQTGFSFFLVDPGESDPGKLNIIEKQLAKGLEEYGIDVQTTASRLQGYLAVENMYLATFQALGGLGLILGAAGLAIVLLRGVWERRAELALLLALGFRARQLAWLVLAENMFLLALGLLAGTVSALLAVAPHLIGAGAQVLWLRIAVLLILVLAVGLVSATLAVWSTLKTPVLTALRRE
jgi:ABC-type antimicrobial peptide transport system permease subunit